MVIGRKHTSMRMTEPATWPVLCCPRLSVRQCDGHRKHCLLCGSESWEQIGIEISGADGLEWISVSCKWI